MKAPAIVGWHCLTCMREHKSALPPACPYCGSERDDNHGPHAIVIELQTNGDPYGRGFIGHQSHDEGRSWFHRGDVGARSREFWRQYARRNGYKLRECR